MKRTKNESQKIILDAAAQLFIQRGIASVKVNDIAEASGIDACMINHHFGGKDGLIEAVIAQALECWKGIDLQKYCQSNQSLLSTKNGQKVFICGLVESVFRNLETDLENDTGKCVLLQLLQYPSEIRTKIVEKHIKPLFTIFCDIYHRITGTTDYEDAYCWFMVLACPQYVSNSSPGLLQIIPSDGVLTPSFSRRLQFVTTQILLSGLGLQ